MEGLDLDTFTHRQSLAPALAGKIVIPEDCAL
jgi:hypothetical protein